MKTLSVVQGTPEWLAARSKSHTASEAPAMMGVSKNVTRNDLLRAKATGSEQEFSAWVQEHILDRGHEVEQLARPLAESIVGEDLYPVTVTTDDGYLLASLDGSTMLGDVIFEHKQWNAELAQYIKQNDTAPPWHYWQVAQGLLISRASKCLFMCSDGTPEKAVWCWIEPEPRDFAHLEAGWRQFDADLAAYKPAETDATIIVAPIESLPALSVTLVGRVESSNLAAWRNHVVARIETINTNLQSDEDFAVAEKTVKFLSDGEAELEACKKQAQSQAASIDELFRTVDALRESMRAKRLTLEKLVKQRKDAIRDEILNGGTTAYAAHLAVLNQRIGRPILTPRNAPQPQFAAVMRGKKTVASLRNAVDTELANAKIESSELAEKIAANLAAVREHELHAPLFPDLDQIVFKAPDDLAALIKVRIADHAERQRKQSEAEAQKAAQPTAPAPSVASRQDGAGATIPLVPTSVPEPKNAGAPRNLLTDIVAIHDICSTEPNAEQVRRKVLEITHAALRAEGVMRAA